MADWDPTQYLKFDSERARPALDLIARIPLRRPRIVFDLGCGPGNSTSMLLAAYPQSRIVGLDRSPAMISRAKVEVPGAEFFTTDIAMWQPDKEADLIFANALFQWLPNHPELLQRIAHAMKREAWLAVQVPDNLGEPSHASMSAIAEQGPWASRLRKASEARADILTPTQYYDLLRPYCSSIDIWHTLYNHPMESHEAIVDMLMSTGLKPYLDLLSEADQQNFLHQYRQAIRSAYQPASNGKVIFRFPRLFILLQK